MSKQFEEEKSLASKYRKENHSLKAEFQNKLEVQEEKSYVKELKTENARLRNMMKEITGKIKATNIPGDDHLESSIDHTNEDKEFIKCSKNRVQIII